MLTGRRPDTTHVGTGARGWCWCQRTGCRADALFMTLPTYFRNNGFVTVTAPAGSPMTAANLARLDVSGCHHVFVGASGRQRKAVSPRCLHGTIHSRERRRPAGVVVRIVWRRGKPYAGAVWDDPRPT